MTTDELTGRVGAELDPPGEGADVLDTVERFLRRFVSFPSPAASVAVALFVAHTYAIDAAEATPYLSIQSAEKRSGKTRVLEVVELLVPRPVRTASASESALFRVIAEGDTLPTLLVDELDSIFPKKAPRPENEALRGVLGAGYRRGSTTLRCELEGKRVKVVPYPVFCPKVLAGIGEPPETIADRSIVIRMRRRTDGEPVEKFRYRKEKEKAGAVREAVAAWVAPMIGSLRDAEPNMPGELDDRAEEGWEPLIAIADAAGGEWPSRARAAALELSANRDDPDGDSAGVRLLSDVRDVFEGERMGSAELVAALAALEFSPWGGDRPITPRTLARYLRGYGIGTENVRFGESVRKGYTRAAFVDAWDRYLTPRTAPPSHDSGFDPLHRYNREDKGFSAENDPLQNPPCSGSKSGREPHGQGDVADVADKIAKVGARSVPERVDDPVEPTAEDLERWSRMAGDEGGRP